jgi:hypothetical protein
MPMTDFNQRNQQVNQQTNIGRDQVIQNIVLVGQFLDFAQVEGLIPKPRIPTDFNSISDAFEKTFAQRLEGDLIKGIAFAGEVLKDGISNWKPKSPISAINRPRIMNDIPAILGKNLAIHDYWPAFSKNSTIWLYSVQLLWTNHFKTNKKDCLFGIYQNNIDDYRFVKSPDGTDRGSIYYDGTVFSIEEFRVFLVGLVIDLIRLYSLASDDRIFWEGFVNLVTSKSGK